MRHRLAIAITACLAVSGGLALWAEASNPKSGTAEHLSTYRWQIQAGWFGGFSGLEISEDGTQLITISDRGQIVSADIARENDVIVSLSNVKHDKVLNKKGKFSPHTNQRDSEGLARLKNGALVVSFEGVHRVEAFTAPGTRPKSFPTEAWFEDMEGNAGFEALAVDPAGQLVVMPEDALENDRLIQAYVLQGKRWRAAFTLRRDKQFQPVGADFGPDGRLYLLERGFNGFGFRTRVRSFHVDKTGASDEKILFRNGIGGHDNLEGLSVWRDAEGRIRLTMISDDNFRLIQRTELVEYVLPQ
ncbi:esterase-like activity of phytase family protein [Shimia sp. R9_1]|uniref:esterase-like activity of phytase family protein n=1 Tax=Shimia sp. R9_1 TaxID=2821111 RepID=UPI001ADC3088|nr:esterase-like activity of phytase family protein [Shimia sp. R9_1]MBO9407136.1 esterase-like activity of phytase family protein [Shimia sp. R9_1]